MRPGGEQVQRHYFFFVISRPFPFETAMGQGELLAETGG